MQMRRAKKEKTAPINWVGIEDISEDEDDTPEAAKQREFNIKATSRVIKRRAYIIKIDELQHAGLFLNWGKYFD
jgi:hypothetical protein